MNLDLPLPRLAAGLRHNDPPATVYVDELLRRVEQVEPHISCLIPEGSREERLHREAKAITERHPEPEGRPALFAIPIGVKDIFRVDGMPTRAGSRLPPEMFAGDEAEAVRRCRMAGALILAKTVTTEFAYFAPGPTRNPRNPGHTPGGSSSGSAAAVAAGLCPLALGTQTIGSIIRPAAYCGIVGFKPTFRRIPVEGVIPLSPSLDHIGFFTLDVAGASLAAGVLCDGWRAPEPSSAPVLGIPAGRYLSRAGDVARKSFDRTADRLASAGYSVRSVEMFADLDDIAARNQTILAAEAAQVHASWFDRFGDLYHDRTARLVLDGRKVSQEDLALARDGQAVMRRELQTAMEEDGIDLWITPATVGPAPRGLETTGDPAMNLPWSQAGFPALTMPCGLDAEGMPLGLQLVARFYDDERLLTWAESIERALDASLGTAPLPRDKIPSPAERGT
jgi:Asp-tRNA(Asn)/Glu-tRNA(Gln) amidotransferase A subunit family amidase